MDKQKSHFVSVSFMNQLMEGDGVENQSNKEQDNVGNEGDDVSLAKLHDVRQAEVCCNKSSAWIKK